MKTTFKYALLIAAALILSATSLTSCSGDDEPEVPEIDVSLKAYKFIYTATASPDMLQFFNVEMTYTGRDGKDKTVQLDSKGFFTDTIEVTEDRLAKTYIAKVVGKRKPGTAIEPGRTFDLKSENWFEREVRNAGKTEWKVLARKPKWKKYEGMTAETLPGLLESIGDELTIMDITYTTVVGDF